MIGAAPSRLGTWRVRLGLAAGAVAAVALLGLAWPWLTSGLPDGVWATALRIGVAVLPGVLGLGFAWSWWKRRRSGSPGLEASTTARARPAIDRMMATLLLPQAGPVRDLKGLPWALVVGAPGAGQAPVLTFAGSGLPVGGADSPCHWRLSPQGVLIDASGALTGDGPAWRHLLRVLKRARPLQPVHAVVLALSASDLLLASAEGRANVALLLERLRELQAGLGVRPPQRLLLTRCRRVDGFPGPAAQARLRSAAAAAGLPHGPEDCLLDADTDPDFAARRDFFGERLYAGAADCIDRVWLARRRRWVVAGYAATVAAVVVVGLLWSVSYRNNLRLIDEVAAGLPALRAKLASLPPPTDADVLALVPTLDAFRDAVPYASAGPPLTSSFGLYQGETIDAAAQLAYRRVLAEALLPRIARGLEDRLRAGAAPSGAMFDALRVYLMLYVPERFDAETVRAWTEADWQARHGASIDPALADALAAHRDALLTLGPVVPPWPVDGTLVDAARGALNQMPLAEIVYHSIRVAAAQGHGEFTVSEAVGVPYAPFFRHASGRPLTRGIPWVFTADGRRGFDRRLQASARDARAEAAWVLGGRADAAAGSADAAAEAALVRDARAMFVVDVVAAWEAYLTDVQLNVPDTPAQRAALARQLAAPDSPLVAWLRALAPQFRGLEAAAPARPGPAQLGTRAPLPPAQQVLDQFTARYAMVARLFDGSPSAVDTLRQALDAYAAQGASDAAALRLQAVVATLPEPLRPMLEALTGRGRAAAGADLAELATLCRQAIDGRYPFEPGAQAEVALADFARLFAPGGAFDGYFDKHLASQVDISTRPWSLRPGASAGVSGEALASFQTAAQWRQFFFADGGSAPGARTQLRVLSLEAPAIAKASKLSPFVRPNPVTLMLIAGGLRTTLAPRGPPVTLSWPDPQGRFVLEVMMGGKPLGGMGFEGPWAMARWLDRLKIDPTSTPERAIGTMRLGSAATVTVEVSMPTAASPRTADLRRFRCPAADAAR